jgi:hypothetical protein
MRNRALLLSVLLLVLNDFVLKARFPGFVTGKLSDLAGLFAFVLFWRGLLPRHTRLVALATALGFLWWKSPWSGTAIAAWNSLGLWHAGRVVDFTDLFCLLVIPLACLIPLGEARPRRRPASLAVAVFSLAAFVATSKMHTLCCQADYILPDATIAQAVARMKHLGMDVSEIQGSTVANAYRIELHGEVCRHDHPDAYVNLTEANGEVRLSVAVLIFCEHQRFDATTQEMLRREVLVPLGAQPAPSTRTNVP